MGRTRDGPPPTRLGRRRGPNHPKTWVAMLGHPACERPVHGGHRAAQVERHVAGLVAFSERTAGQRSFHVLPSAPIQFRFAGVPCSPPPPFVAPSPFVQPCLPVWPSTRSQWPPRSMCCGGGFGQARFRGGVRGCSCLSRGWGLGHHERQDPGHGHVLGEKKKNAVQITSNQVKKGHTEHANCPERNLTTTRHPSTPAWRKEVSTS